MTFSKIDYILLFFSSFILVGVLTPIIRRFAILYGIMDRPNSLHKTHHNPVPYLGGIGIIIGVITICYLGIISSEFTRSNFWLATSLLGPAVFMGLVGLWDDLKSLKPLPRLFGQSIAGLVVAIFLILNDNIGNPVGITSLDLAITVLWIVGICNSINFFDNIDGGAAGAVSIAAISLTFLAILGNQFFIAALSIVVAGSTLGFLIWNKDPARIYMGDTGALFLGVLIATLTVRFEPSTDTAMASFALPIGLLAVPILDTTVAVFSRFRRRISPLVGGMDHLSHRLIRFGLSRRKSVITLWILSTFYCLLAILISIGDKFYETVFLVIGLFTWIMLLKFFLSMRDS